MILDFDPGDKVINPINKEWGIGQVQSIINGKVTVNFENVGKKLKRKCVLLDNFTCRQLFRDVGRFHHCRLPPLSSSLSFVDRFNGSSIIIAPTNA